MKLRFNIQGQSPRGPDVGPSELLKTLLAAAMPCKVSASEVQSQLKILP